MIKKNTLLGFLISFLVLGMVVSCAGEDDIDRTQANRLPKSMFEGTWYIRSTVVGVPATSAASFVGDTGVMEKIRWEVQEDFLIAYRAYEEIPGTDSANKSQYDPDEYKENPIAAFPIKAHFDIKRSYNPSTGEQTNVIEENTIDRPWYEREWLRVDWATSKVDAMAFAGVTGGIEHNASYFVQGHEDSPDAMRAFDKDGNKIYFENLSTITDNLGVDWGQKVDYFDMVGKFLLEPEKVKYQYSDGTISEIPLCYFINYGGRNYQTASCGPTEVKVRTAFLKVGQRNYEPVEYPDREMGKFGFFRTERFSWDRKYGFTEKGRTYLAGLHNIWEKAYETHATGAYKLDEDGNKILIEVKDRIPKPIVYQLNEYFPCELIATAQQISGSWNNAFRRAVAVAKGLLTETQGDTASELADLPTTAEEAKANGKEGLWVPRQMFKVGLNGWVQKEEGDDWSCENLERDESKVIARLGDLRFSFMAWVPDRQITGPLGYGPSSPDPETGEIVAGMAHIYGAALDEYAGRTLEIIRVLNNDLSINDVMTGDYVKDYIAKNKTDIDPAKIPAEVKKIKGAQIRDLFLSDKMKAKMETLRKQGLEKAMGAGDRKRLDLIKGTQLEDYLLDEEIIKGVAPHMLQGQAFGPDDTLPKQARDLVSPLNWASADAKALNKLRWTKAAQKTIWLAEFADDDVLGLALEMWKKWGATKDYDAMWQHLRELIFRGVTEHEIGHTVGLRHNFAGSYDSINYFNKYWDLRSKKDAQGKGGLIERNALKESEALNFGELYTQAMLTEDQIKGRMREYQYSSIMDYGATFNSDIHGIGKWDEAAILFGYTGQTEVFDNPSKEAKVALRQRFDDCSPRYESIPNLAYSPVLEQWHYSSIWNLLGKTDGLVTRRFRKWSDVKKEQDDATQACKLFVEDKEGTVSDFNQQNDGNRDLEVPYSFCSDEYVGATVSCQVWDQGADPKEIVDNVIERYKNYYFFNNYKRDRFGFDSYSLYSRIASRYFTYLPNVYQHWLFRVASYGVDDVNLDNYWTAGTFEGFNLLMEVLNKPEYGTYCKINDSFQCSDSGTQWARINSTTTPTEEANRLVIDRGDGRRRYSLYDYDSGYYYQYQTLEVGHFWEYLAALEMLTASTGVFVGVEVSSDFTRYLVPYYILFEDAMTRYFEDVVTENYDGYAPRIVNGKLVNKPAALLSLTNGQSLDPATGQVVENTKEGEPLYLSNWFTLKFYTLLYGMAEFRSLYSLRYADRQQVFRVGSGEEVTPAPGKDLVTCQDPIGGHIYGAIDDPTISDEEKSGAVVLVNRCAQQVQTYEDLKLSAPDTTNFYNARAEMNDTIEWLNFMRGLYGYYGSNF
ncbi:MAG: zinc-dependent metalloprotease [Pseudomonadota bacterium]